MRKTINNKHVEHVLQFASRCRCVCVCLSPFGPVGCGRPLLVRSCQINVINRCTVMMGPPLFWLENRLGVEKRLAVTQKTVQYTTR